MLHMMVIEDDPDERLLFADAFCNITLYALCENA